MRLFWKRRRMAKALSTSITKWMGRVAAHSICPPAGVFDPATHETVDKKMHFVHQDGQAVFKYAVRKMGEACEKVLARNGVSAADINCFIPHQANQRIINATAERVGLKPESVIINIDRYGNTTAGTIPLAMQTAVEEGRLKKGDLVMLASSAPALPSVRPSYAGRSNCLHSRSEGRNAGNSTDNLTFPSNYRPPHLFKIV